MRVWMAMDPETRRVFVKDTEFSDGDFPIGPRGVGWPRRELARVSRQRYERLLLGERAGVTGQEQDEVHREWWDKAKQKGEPPWPLMPDGT